MESVPGAVAVATGSHPHKSPVSNTRTRSLPLPVLTSFSLAISSRLAQIIIDHPAPILLRLRHRRVAAFFVPTDLVFGVESFEREFAGGDRLPFIRAFEVERNQSRLDQLRN